MTTFTGTTSILKFSLLIFLISFYFSFPTKKLADNKIEKKHFVVALLPYKGFDATLIDFVNKETETFYQCKVVALKPVELPSFAFYAPRNRYKADSLLVYEDRLINKGIDAIAGLTNKDISTSKDKIPDWGVFGLGMCPGQVCVISTHRLQDASVPREKLKERLIKVVLHEIGHNLGLPHCTNDPECLMTDAGGTIKQVDREKKWICPSCRLKLIM